MRISGQDVQDYNQNDNLNYVRGNCGYDYTQLINVYPQVTKTKLHTIHCR